MELVLVLFDLYDDECKDDALEEFEDNDEFGVQLDQVDIFFIFVDGMSDKDALLGPKVQLSLSDDMILLSKVI